MTWMTQTHSTICHTVNEQIPFTALIGDGLITQTKGHALMMMTADCLPVVLGNAEGTEIANLHAGWRGLAGGIIESTVAAMQSPPTWAWLGAAISQPCFEIGAEVKTAFCSKYPELETAFIDGAAPNKFHADLYAIARFILQSLEVEKVLGEISVHTNSKMNIFLIAVTLKLAVWQLLFLCSFEKSYFFLRI